MDKRYLSRPDAVRVTVTVEVAQAVLWHFGDQRDGVQSGSFVTRLLQACGAADAGNRAKLAAGFPEYVAAFDLVVHHSWGLEYLQGIARRATAPDQLDIIGAVS